MTISLSALMKQRGDTAANWTAANPTLLANELAYETDTQKWKVGDGSTAWTSLAYTPWSQISSYPIVNADIAAAAEIAVSKLADGDARQLLQTDAAGTGVEWASNIDVPGTLDVAGVATFDSNVTIEGDLQVNGTTTTIDTQTLVVEDKNIELGNVTTPSDVTADGGGITLLGSTNKTINWIDATDAWTSSERFDFPAGTAAAPSIILNGDVNSGIYQPGADQVAISTGGTGRLFIDSSGRVGVGTTSPASILHLSGSSDQIYTLQTTTSGADNRINFRNSGGTDAGGIWYKHNGNHLIFNTGGSNGEKVRIDGSGRVGIGTSSPGNYHPSYDNLVVGSTSTDSGVTIFSSTTGTGGLIFADGTSANDRIRSSITYSHANDLLNFSVNSGQSALVIDSSKRVGIGTTSPGCALDVVSQTVPQLRVRYASGGDYVSLLHNNSDAYLDTTAGGLVFRTSTSTERARIDSSGRLLVGTSSTSAGTRLVVEGNSAGSSGQPGVTTLALSDNTLSDGSALGVLAFSDNGHTSAATVISRRDGGIWTSGSSQPTRLVFSTTADGASSPTERMRIKNDGTVTFGSNGSNDPIGSSFSGQLVLGPSGSAGAINYYNSSNPALKLGVGANGDIVTFFRNQPSATTVGSISVTTTATSYNTSSDYRLKENVVDLDGAITRVKQLAPKRFNFIADTETTVDGFLAHEAQTVVPEAVTGTKDEVDDDGNAVMQGIDQSKLVPLLTAALQEAIAKIEILEAKVAALEGN